VSESQIDLRPHQFSIALMQPQIAPNTGNIGRLCVATGTQLHLVRPFGFVLSDRNLKRSAMDYWDRLQLTIHDDDAAFFAAIDRSRCWFFTSKSQRSYWDADFVNGDCLVFGSETYGLSESLLATNPNRCVRIPQTTRERCLNVSTAAGIGLFEALRRTQNVCMVPSPGTPGEG
jgi:tRNA (cytidine/uridine-2'-O-)-methyltransferase